MLSTGTMRMLVLCLVDNILMNSIRLIARSQTQLGRPQQRELATILLKHDLSFGARLACHLVAQLHSYYFRLSIET